MLPVHLRFTDAVTGHPTAVRLSVTGADGRFYAPLGRFDRFPAGPWEVAAGHLRLGNESFVAIDGGCEIALPAGVPLRFRATKGPAYVPFEQTETLSTGQMTMRFNIVPVTDHPLLDWVAADTRVHALSPHDALIEAAAEDVQFVNLLARARPILASDGETYPTVANLSAFTGRKPAVEGHGTQVVVNTLNTHPVLGRVGLLNAHRVIHPLAFGGADGPDDWSVCDWCDQCHRKGGLVTWVDAFRNDVGPPGGEALVAAVLGKVDAIELDTRLRAQPFLPWYYRLLTAGVMLPLVGGSGKDSTRTPIGCPRTYSKPTGPGYAGWVDGVLAGRTVVTTGPLLNMTVGDCGPGDTLAAANPGVEVPVKVTVAGAPPGSRLEVLQDGLVIAATDAAFKVLAFDVAPAESGWLAARCVSTAASVLDPAQPALAHTSPVWVKVAGKPLPARKPASTAVKGAVLQTREWLAEQATFADPRRRAQHLARCDQALGLLGGP